MNSERFCSTVESFLSLGPDQGCDSGLVVPGGLVSVPH
jgi:hypothetical protein